MDKNVIRYSPARSSWSYVDIPFTFYFQVVKGLLEETLTSDWDYGQTHTHTTLFWGGGGGGGGGRMWAGKYGRAAICLRSSKINLFSYSSKFDLEILLTAFWMAEEETSVRVRLPHSCCAVHKDNCYLYNLGCGGPSINIEVYNFESSKWHIVKTLVSGMPGFKTGGCCCLVIKDSLYVFGNLCCYGRCTTNVHELNLNNYKWRTINSTNPEEGPLCKGGAGMVDYGEEMLCVMGGYGHPAARNSDDDMTNELHIFHISLGEEKYFVLQMLILYIIFL